MQRIKTKLGVLQLAAVALLALFAVGCDTDSPTAPQTPTTPPPPPSGPPASAVWNITVTANPSTIEIPEGAASVSTVISVVVRRADNNQPPPDGATAVIRTAFASGAVVLNGGSGSAVLTISSPTAGSVVVEASFERSVGQTVIDLVAAAAFRIDRVTPDQGPPEGGTVVTILGGGFAEPVRVTFGGLVAVVRSVTESAIVVETPRFDGLTAGEIRRVAVEVTIRVNEANEQTDTLADAFSYLVADAGTLFIERLVPDEGPPSGGTDVTILGDGFEEPVRVNFGGLAATVNSVTRTAIRVETPRFDGLAAGDTQRVDVTVTVNVNEEGELSDTLAGAFTYISDFFVDQLVPSEGSPTGGERVRILGRGFEEPVRVLFGDDRADVVSVDPTVILVETPAIDLPVGETRSVAVTVVINVNQADQLSDSLANAFLYTRSSGGGALVPRIISITPTSGPNEGGTDVTIRGEGFADEVQVFFGTGTLIEAEVTDVSPARILAVTPAATGFNSVNRDSIVDVLVRNVASGFEDTLSGGFQYGSVDNPPVFISAVGPTEGLYTGGDIVTIFGSGFEGPVTVVFGDFAQDVLSVTGTEIVVRSVRIDPDSCADISGAVAVTNIETGQGATGPTWTYRVFDPAVGSLQPGSIATDAAGNPLGDATMTITGSGFDPPVLVEFGELLALGTTLVDSSTLTLTIPPFTGDFDTEACDDNGDGTEGERLAPTRVDLTVTNELSGCDLTLTDGFTYVPPSDCVGDLGPPRVLEVIGPDGDNIGDEDGGETVTIAGLGFQDPAAVDFGGVSASGVTFISETELSARVPPFTGTFNEVPCGNEGMRFVPTPVDVTVTNLSSDLSGTRTGAYLYEPDDTSCREPPVEPDPPVASFAITAKVVVGPGGTVDVTDTSQNVTALIWDFGDFTTLVNALPGSTTMHAYAADGTFTITLTVTGTDGSQTSTSQMVTFP